MNHLTIVTGNEHKYSEIARSLPASLSIKQSTIDLVEAQSLDMMEISKNKAIEAFKILQEPVLVDDSGFYITAYIDFPGTFSKFLYQQLQRDWLYKLLEWESKDAYFQCVISYMDQSLSEPISFVWTHEWIVDFDKEYMFNPKMPYDSLFSPKDWSTQPLHRSRAVEAFVNWYNQRLSNS